MKFGVRIAREVDIPFERWVITSIKRNGHTKIHATRSTFEEAVDFVRKNSRRFEWSNWDEEKSAKISFRGIRREY